MQLHVGAEMQNSQCIPITPGKRLMLPCYTAIHICERIHGKWQYLLIMSHESMSCLTQSFLSTIKEENDWRYQLNLRICNEYPSRLQHNSNRRGTIRSTYSHDIGFRTAQCADTITFRCTLACSARQWCDIRIASIRIASKLQPCVQNTTPVTLNSPHNTPCWGGR